MGLAGIVLDFPDFGRGERRVVFLGGTGFQARSDYKFIILHSKILNFHQLAAGYPRESLLSFLVTFF